MEKTQKQKLIDLLTQNSWVCSTTFQERYIPEFRSLIAHMRKHEGYKIIDEPCLGKCGKNHKSKGLKRWKMVLSDQIKYSKEYNTTRPCNCNHYHLFGGCYCTTSDQQLREEVKLF